MLNNFKNSVLVLLCLLFSYINLSQSISNFNDINFSELKDNQIELLLRRASAQGFSQFDLLKIAKQQGMNENEISVLSKKFSTSETLSRVAESSSSPLNESRLRKQYKEKLEVFREFKSDVFGYNIFRGNTLLTFQSNLNIPTPLDYIIGPGDQLYIDIYGESENYYKAEVSPEGDVILDNIYFKPRYSYNDFYLKEDKIKVSSILRDLGYYFSEVDILTEFNKNKNQINLIYKIDLGQKAKIKKIYFTGNKIFKDSKLKSLIVSEEHKPWKFISGKKYLNENIINFDLRLLKNFYLNEGYYNVNINSSFARLVDDDKFELQSLIKEHPIYKKAIMEFDIVDITSIEEVPKLSLVSNENNYKDDKVEDK